ncbi:hypothetical protein PAHAL_6G163000 [Panicum hallii]|uniref:Acyltransferase n=1 Tax=Panicum hallii TaxID=206008 RepID=A0A2S3I1V5_9POAL|nr:hypothetical protein PAHAL_6G163000 [Panicum hallii]
MKDDDGREEEGTSARVFRPGTTTAAGASLSLARAMAALLLWQGAIHFNVALAAACAFVFPARVAMLVLCTQLFSVLVPADGTSRFGSSIARFICKHGLGYFPVTLQVEHYEAFDPQGAYVFGYEPHSIMPFGAWALTEPASCMPLPKMKILTSSAAFYIPLMRQIWMWLGSVPATREIFCSHLADGYSCVVSPGGLRETLHMNPGLEVAFIKSRKGFVKIAMQNGCPLVPIFCFGQNDAYKWWNPDIKLLTRIATALKSIPVIYWGKFGTPIPYRTPMHVFVGKPIPVEKRGQPTKNEVWYYFAVKNKI